MSTSTSMVPLHRPQSIGVDAMPHALLLSGETPADTLPAAVQAYNRFVHEPSEVTRRAVESHGDARLSHLADIAAYVLGVSDVVPTPDVTLLDEELLAHALIVQAAAFLEQGHSNAAHDVLIRAASAARTTSPLLAAQAVLQIATLRRDQPGVTAAQIVAELDTALTLLGERPAAALRGDIWLQRALVLHEASNDRGPESARGLLLEAVKCYQQALRIGLDPDIDPESFALAHSNLALAYLSMPATDSSDTLRLAVAVQSLRAALSVYQRETHPEQWARVQMHLANALVYLPSGHRQENIAQAVDLYEELLSVRSRAMDPLGHARVLANQANALAHLGVFNDATEKLHEAHKLAQWHEDAELAAEAMALLDRITERRAEVAHAE
jgi:tetratricopeptide (TPR) repeat protein